MVIIGILGRAGKVLLKSWAVLSTSHISEFQKKFPPIKRLSRNSTIQILQKLALQNLKDTIETNQLSVCFQETRGSYFVPFKLPNSHVIYSAVKVLMNKNLLKSILDQIYLCFFCCRCELFRASSTLGVAKWTL